MKSLSINFLTSVMLRVLFFMLVLSSCQDEQKKDTETVENSYSAIEQKCIQSSGTWNKTLNTCNCSVGRYWDSSSSQCVTTQVQTSSGLIPQSSSLNTISSSENEATQLCRQSGGTPQVSAGQCLCLMNQQIQTTQLTVNGQLMNVQYCTQSVASLNNNQMALICQQSGGIADPNTGLCNCGTKQKQTTQVQSNGSYINVEYCSVPEKSEGVLSKIVSLLSGFSGLGNQCGLGNTNMETISGLGNTNTETISGLGNLNNGVSTGTIGGSDDLINQANLLCTQSGGTSYTGMAGQCNCGNTSNTKSQQLTKNGQYIFAQYCAENPALLDLYTDDTDYFYD